MEKEHEQKCDALTILEHIDCVIASLNFSQCPFPNIVYGELQGAEMV